MNFKSSMRKFIQDGQGGPEFDLSLLIKSQWIPHDPGETTIYYYRNFTICFSKFKDQEGIPVQLMSLAPHGMDLSPLEDSELYGMLKHFRFQLGVPIDSWTKDRPDIFGMGTIVYFGQEIAMDKQACN